VGSDDELILPASSLSQNYPNPFNPETTIYFTTENAENSEIIIYNIKGQQVCTLVNEVFPAGRHSVLWDGKDNHGKHVSSGIYFYKLKAGNFVDVKKAILLK
ncbi:MAG: T9SS type A sorting domain-containing protein, partial [Candidatus Cloacimonetes bacterium]|nr:T9SS type A sorting domain-containing protein [Candidatus Cloacimonadota bacterium]